MSLGEFVMIASYFQQSGLGLIEQVFFCDHFLELENNNEYLFSIDVFDNDS